jgi:TetR/AcrR family transcriptional regulator, transcriptional repressor for nem operon
MPRPRVFDEDTVLDRALDLFWHQGYEATSMQQLVDALGINRASLYDTFSDKYTLYRRALDRYRQRSQSVVCGLLSQNRPAPELLREFLDGAVTDSVTDCQGKGCFCVNAAVELAPHDPDVARLVNANQQTVETALETLLRRGQAEGHISPGHDPAHLARFVYNTLTGLKTTGKSNRDEAALRSIVTVTMSLLTGVSAG